MTEEITTVVAEEQTHMVNNEPAEEAAAAETPITQDAPVAQEAPQAEPEGFDYNTLTMEELDKRIEEKKTAKPEAKKEPVKEPEKVTEPADVVEEANDEEEEDDSPATLYAKGADGKFIPKGKAIPVKQHKKTMEAKDARIAQLEAEAKLRDKEREESAAALLALIAEKKQPEATPDDSENDDEDDFDFATKKDIKALARQLKEEMAKEEVEKKAKAEAESVNANLNNFVTTAASERAEFEKSTPDYADALGRIIAVKVEEAMLSGMDKAAANSKAMADIALIAGNAWANGKNTAQAVYELSSKYGYQKPAALATKKKPEPDIKAIAENMKKTANINDIKGEGAEGAGRTRFPSTEELTAKYMKVDPRTGYKVFDEKAWKEDRQKAG